MLLIRSGCRVQAGPGAGDNCPILALYSWCWAGHQGENCNKTPDTRITAAAADPPRPALCLYLLSSGRGGEGGGG